MIDPNMPIAFPRMSFQDYSIHKHTTYIRPCEVYALEPSIPDDFFSALQIVQTYVFCRGLKEPLCVPMAFDEVRKRLGLPALETAT